MGAAGLARDSGLRVHTRETTYTHAGRRERWACRRPWGDKLHPVTCFCEAPSCAAGGGHANARALWSGRVRGVTKGRGHSVGDTVTGLQPVDRMKQHRHSLQRQVLTVGFPGRTGQALGAASSDTLDPEGGPGSLRSPAVSAPASSWCRQQTQAVHRRHLPLTLPLSFTAGDVGLGEGPERQPAGEAHGQPPPGTDSQSGDCLGRLLGSWAPGP